MLEEVFLRSEVPVVCYVVVVAVVVVVLIVVSFVNLSSLPLLLSSSSPHHLTSPDRPLPSTHISPLYCSILPSLPPTVDLKSEIIQDSISLLPSSRGGYLHRHNLLHDLLACRLIMAPPGAVCLFLLLQEEREAMDISNSAVVVDAGGAVFV